MVDFFYTLLIFPLIQLLELVYLFVYRVFDPGIAIIGVSAAVSVLTLPVYLFAEKHQEAERNTQKRLKLTIDMIKQVFKGDEQYMILSTYYRQNHYHPIYAMRNTISLLIQIPFFIAAYAYLSHLEVLRETSFFFIKDLGKPDMLISIAGLGFNVLPVLMTMINCISGAIYTKGFPVKDKIQLYSMAGIFLVLLYNSPAGLVLYWMLNNIFSLIKNILQKTKHSKIIIYCALCILALLFDIYLLFFHTGYIVKRVFIICLVSLVFFIPLFTKLLLFLGKKLQKIKPKDNDTALGHNRTFILSIIILFLLTGLVIPAALVSSSTQEFSFIESYGSPFPFILNTCLQAAGIFLFWPLCIYFLFPSKIKKYIAGVITLLSITALINTFIFPGDYGFISTTLVFSNPGTFLTDLKISLINIAVLILIICTLPFLLLIIKKNIIYSLQTIILITLLSFGIINSVKIFNDFSKIAEKENQSGHAPILKPVYTFSKTEKNILIIMADRGISSFIPYIFAERPELLSEFSGFKWYPNCLSFGRFTVFGAPPLFGGYEYVPLEMQKRDTVPLLDKYNESLLVLPRIFMDNNFSVTVTDPSWANFSWKPDLKIYEKYPAIHAENIVGKYSSLWLEEHPDVKLFSVANILKNNLIRFSIFKTMPVISRTFIWDRGKWLTTSALTAGDLNELTILTIDEYSVLDYLSDITTITDDGQGEFTMLVSQLTHEPSFLQFPDYVPAVPVTDKGNGPFAEDPAYHVDSAALIMLGRWFNFLKEQEVYDNTRIIIVSDHGSDLAVDFPPNIKLPNGDNLQLYNALLMVKDFNSEGELLADNTFMTNADVPLLALENIIVTPLNPFTAKPLVENKKDGVTITTSSKLHPTKHFKYTYNIGRNEWLNVHDDVTKPENWKALAYP
ncbi:membrane protein [Spirochaetia bacterium]|nr:membrane protein [Spirochaetia bacterium]